MPKSEYETYLQSDHWRDVKARMRASKYLQRCYVCGSAGPLDLHHKTYKRLGMERLNDLIWLCRECRTDVHQYIREHEGAVLWGAARRLRKSKLSKTGRRVWRAERRRLRQAKRNGGNNGLVQREGR